MPPIALEVVHNPTGADGQFHGIESVVLYLFALAGFAILMGIAALVVRLVARGRARQVLLLALAGSLPGPDDLPPEAVLTPDMAETVELVDVANSAFPRGPEFARTGRPARVPGGLGLARCRHDRARGADRGEAMPRRGRRLPRD